MYLHMYLKYRVRGDASRIIRGDTENFRVVFSDCTSSTIGPVMMSTKCKQTHFKFLCPIGAKESDHGYMKLA